ncbi:MAG: lysophospholipase [Alistipes sp.]|nr:lysophospholipase [Alistipes sp.]
MKNSLICISLCTLLMMATATAAAAEREVRIDCPWGTIYATLATPDGDTQPSTAVVIIAGSGPTDRNGNSAMGLSPASYRLLSDELCAAGFAVLRYDKRAIGRSTCPMELLADLTFDDYVDDAARCIAFLREQGFDKVVPIGHSEGSLIALCAAQAVPVDGIVSLSGAGYRFDVILNRQLAGQLLATDMGLMVRASTILNSLAAGKRVDEVPQALQPLLGGHVQPFIMSQLRYDPANLARRTRQPMLIVTGGNDIQITPDNAERLHAAAPGSRLVILPLMTHVLKDCDSTDMMTQISGVYSNSTLPITEGLSAAITEFLQTI